MKGNELKQIIQTYSDKDGLHKEFCEAIIAGQNLTDNPLTQTEIQNVLSKVELLYKLRDFNFAESNDKNFADWKRVRAEIEHENTLLNHRLTWLFSSQAFLITSYTLAFIQWGKTENIDEAKSVYPILLLVIASFAIVLCFYIWYTLLAAVSQITVLDDWWYCRNISKKNIDDTEKTREQIKVERDDNKEILDKTHPPLQGRRRDTIKNRIINTESIPLVFIVTWICLMFFSVLLRYVQIGNTFSVYWREILIVALAAFTLCLLSYILLSKRRK